MTERDIRGLFKSLPAPEDDEQIIALRLGEEAFVILNRIADALEQIALNTIPGPKRGVDFRVRSYSTKPYSRLIVPESDGTFRGEILEFPGCIATGDTPNDALISLEAAATAWIESALAADQHIPEPIENTEFSGRIVVRMPKSLHKKASRYAEYERVSLNQFIVTSLSESVGERNAFVAMEAPV